MTHLLILLTVCTSLVTGQVAEPPSEPEYPASLKEHGRTFARIGDWENGLKYLEPYILAHPEDAEARLLLAECYFNWPDKRVVGDSTVDLNQERGEVQIGVLAKLGDPGFEMLLKGLHSETAWVLHLCCAALSEKKDRRAIDDLIKVVQGSDTVPALEALDALVAIESDREQIDGRVVQALTSVLQRPNAHSDLRTDAARAAATLRIKDAVPVLKKELERIAAALPTAEREDRNQAIKEMVYFIDAIARINPQDLEAYGGPVVEKMRSAETYDLFERVRLGGQELAQETLAFFWKTALRMVEVDPGLFRGAIYKFVDHASTLSPALLLRDDIKDHLHKLCDAPQRDLRLKVIEILGNIRDEDALPILLPRLRAVALPQHEGLRVAQASLARHPTVRRPQERQWFAWGSDEAHITWEAVKAIASARTSEFLLEKLESDDLAWVYTAVRLLEDIGEGRAIEPLKKRYAKIAEGADPEDELAMQVLESIEQAYLSLSGRPITDPGT
jgi:HEAT repeat protein